MSSRNERLSEQGRQKAAFIYKVLQEAKALFASSPIAEVKAFVEKQFAQEPAFELEYFLVVDENTLQEATQKEAHKAYRAFVAAYIEGVRLIDNLSL